MEATNSNLEEIYNNWYQHSYMDDWPLWKKERVSALIKSVNLPTKGNVLDFGCGSGVFTRLLKEVLPGWNVYGSDLSEVAMSIGRERSNNVTYIHSSDCPNDYFDFIFTHHVLEHVDDIRKVEAIISKLAKRDAILFNILPCGNEGSLEYFFASNMTNGINLNKGNTFFFEEELHLNRFTTKDLEIIFSVSGWGLSDAFYANHSCAVLSWIAGMNTQFIKKVTDYKKAYRKKVSFIIYRIILLAFYYLQRPYTYFKLRKLKKGWTGPLLRHPQLKPKREIGITEVLLFPSFLIVIVLDLMERMDWWFMKKKRNGGEMYLIFKRNI